jgi:tellurite resistance protein TerC
MMVNEATIIATVPMWIWMAFNIFIVGMILLDLCFLHKNKHAISLKEALTASSIWIGMALAFNVGIYYTLGKGPALDFLAGYLIEKSLSVDNLFVFIAIFDYFHTPSKYQHKVLFWGILGAIVLRALFIFFGIALVDRFHFILYIFGLFLIYAAIKMAMPKDDEIHPERNPVIKLFKKFMPVTHEYSGSNFFIKKDLQWYATPLFIALLTVEMSDVMFALDSIPAIMAITLDPFIIYTSNIFAILGLRALYFALAGLFPLFHFLKYGLALILAFVGVKMLIEPFIEIPIEFALGFIIATIAASTLASVACAKKDT